MSDLPTGHGPLASSGYHLLLAARAWRRELGVRLRPLGITPTQFDTIGALGWLSRSSPDPTQQEVADFAAMDRMMLSKLVTGLECRGILLRVSDPLDARHKRLRLTSLGRELVTEATAIARTVDAELFTGVESRQRFHKELQTIVERATPVPSAQAGTDHPLRTTPPPPAERTGARLRSSPGGRAETLSPPGLAW